MWDSDKACQCPLDKSTSPAYPLKPSRAGEPGRILLRKVDGWTCSKVEVGKLLIRPEGAEFALPNRPPAAFHETRRVPTLSHEARNEFFQRLSRFCSFHVLILLSRYILLPVY